MILYFLTDKDQLLMYKLSINDISSENKQLHLIPKKNFHSINTIEYLGSKKNLLGFILPEIFSVCNKGDVLLDLFSGTCSVGFAAQERNIIYANDSQVYSYHISKTLLNPIIELREKHLSIISNSLNRNFNSLIDYWDEDLSIEKKFLDRNITPDFVNEYHEWCINTDYWGDIESAKNNKFTRKKIHNDLLTSYKDNNNKFPYMLFSRYYMNAYFGVRQCLEIDAIRYAIDEIEEENIRSIFLTALMSSMSKVVSSTTHFAQFLNTRTINSVDNLIQKRSKSIWEHFIGF